MGIQVDWVNEDKTVMLWKFEGEIERRELLEAQSKGEQLAESVTHNVDMIMDFQNYPIPANFPDYFVRFLGESHLRSDHIKIVIIIQASRLIRVLFRSFIRARQAGKLVFFAESHTEALQILAGHDHRNT